MFLERIISVLNNCHNILHVIDSVQQGSIILQSGNHVVEVRTRREPVSIALSLTESYGMPVCNGDVDKIGYTILPNGFIIYADIVSDTVQIEWNALFNIENSVQ